MYSKQFTFFCIILFVLFFIVCSNSTSNNDDCNALLLTQPSPPSHENGIQLYTCAFPQWTANGLVYFIESVEYSLLGGSIWSIRDDGTEKHIFAKGKYVWVSVSGNASLITATQIRIDDYNIIAESLVVFDTLGNTVCKFPIKNAKYFITKAISQDSIYILIDFEDSISNQDGIYIFSLCSGMLDLVLSVTLPTHFDIGGFDVSQDGSLFLIGFDDHIEIYTDTSTYNIYDWCGYPHIQEEFILASNGLIDSPYSTMIGKFDLTGNIIEIYSFTQCKDYSYIQFPCSEPNGSRILFAGTWSMDGIPGYYSLYMIN